MVVDELHIPHDGPRRAAVLIARGEHDRVAYLCRQPVVFHQVPLDHDPLRVLELEQVLDVPVGLVPPGQLLREMVASDGDVGRDQSDNRRIRATEDDVLGSRFEIVVGMVYGPGPFQLAIACESCAFALMFEMYES